MMKIIAKTKDKEGFYLVLCPKEKKKIADYNCMGSFIKGTETCVHLRSGIIGPEGAEMKCEYPEKVEGHQIFTIGLGESKKK